MLEEVQTASPEGAANPGVGAPGAEAAAEAAQAQTPPTVGESGTGDEWEAFRAQCAQFNVKPDQLVQAYSLAHHLATEDGRRQMFQEMSAEFGSKLFDEQLADRLSTSRGRRALERAISRMREGTPEAQSQGGEYPGLPGLEASGTEDQSKGMLLDAIESLKSELAAVKAKAERGERVAVETGAALDRDAEFRALAQKNELAGRLFPDMVSEATELMRRYPARYAGPGGATRAATDFLKGFEARAARAGLQRPTNGTVIPRQGNAGTVATKPPDVSKMSAVEKAEAIVRWVRDNPGA